LTHYAAQWYESHALRSDDVQPLPIAARGAAGSVVEAARLDELDRGIMEALQANGRESFRRIAVELGVSEATVRARYARLTRNGILQVVGVTNPLELGFELALVGVATSGPPEDVAHEIAGWPEAAYVVVVAGRFDVLVELVVSHRREVLDLTNRMRTLADVVSTETFLYIELWKQLYDWGAPRALEGRHA
jgi:Lrp/AsnC family transcriptional regulator for asnA, asnC and gidA